MHVETTRRIDASEPDENGVYDYYYEYDTYRFTNGANCFVARSYINEPDEAHFLRAELDGHPRPLVASDLAHPLFISAQTYLYASGKCQLNWFSGKGDGYESLQSDKTPRA